MNKLIEAARAVVDAIGSGREVYIGFKKRRYEATFDLDRDPVQALRQAVKEAENANHILQLVTDRHNELLERRMLNALPYTEEHEYQRLSAWIDQALGDTIPPRTPGGEAVNEQLEKLAVQATREALRGLGYDEANRAIKAAFRQVVELCAQECESRARLTEDEIQSYLNCDNSGDVATGAADQESRGCAKAIRALVEEK